MVKKLLLIGLLAMGMLQMISPVQSWADDDDNNPPPVSSPVDSAS